MDRRASIQAGLQQLGLTKDEVAVFLCLLDAPKSLLEVSRVTGIARSNVYRIAADLADRSIVHEITTGDEKVLAATRPEALELLVVEQEAMADNMRASLNKFLPMLHAIQGNGNNFSIKTYSGAAGLKQMLWNELKAKGEILVFAHGSLDPGVGKLWAERYRGEVIRRGIVARGIENVAPNFEELSKHKEYVHHYFVRTIPEALLPIELEVIIYNDTVALYNAWTNTARLGAEIKNPFFATLMRHIFEHYWSLALPTKQ